MMGIQVDLQSLTDRFRAWARTFRGSITLFSLVGLLLIPLSGNEYVTIILVAAMIYSIFAASWDFLAGFAGQVSFGHAAFFGISGYFTAAFVKFAGTHWIIALFIGAGYAVIFSLLIGIPCLRLKGPYLALGTLAFSLILWNLFLTGTWLGRYLRVAFDWKYLCGLLYRSSIHDCFTSYYAYYCRFKTWYNPEVNSR